MILILHMPDSCPKDKAAAEAAAGSKLLGRADAGTVIAVWEDAAMILKQPVPSVQFTFEVQRIDG